MTAGVAWGIIVRRANGADRDRASCGRAREDPRSRRDGKADRVRFSRRTRSLDALLPVLYLRGVSTGDFQEALAALLGKDSPNF